jgi:hypothetical protein
MHAQGRWKGDGGMEGDREQGDRGRGSLWRTPLGWGDKGRGERCEAEEMQMCKRYGRSQSGARERLHGDACVEWKGHTGVPRRGLYAVKHSRPADLSRCPAAVIHSSCPPHSIPHERPGDVSDVNHVVLRELR